MEVLLQRERKAREGAEERARRLLASHSSKSESDESDIIEEEAFDPPADSLNTDKKPVLNGHVDEAEDQPDKIASTPTQAGATKEVHHGTASVNASTTRIQEKLDLMVREMDEMKIVMESYKRRAETAEEERKGLAEMVQQIRSNAAAVAGKTDDKSILLQSSLPQDSDAITSRGLHSTFAPSASATASSSTHASNQYTSKHLNGYPTTGVPPSSATQTDYDMSELERTVSAALQEASRSQRWGRAGWGSNGGNGAMVQGAPYASMVGVVLIGVGIMTWLNGWQRGER